MKIIDVEVTDRRTEAVLNNMISGQALRIAEISLKHNSDYTDHISL